MVHHIIMPDLGQTSGEGKILKWLKRPGDAVSKGDLLLEVETDKAIVQVEAYVGGYLRQILVAENETAAAAQPIAIITDRLDEAYRPGAEAELREKSRQPAVSPPAGRRSPSSRVKAAPAARALARQLAVDLAEVVGTGPDGLVSREDVERYHRNQSDENSP